MKAVTLDHITKTYDKGRVTAVKDISFDVQEGELFGLIGPDGAGKSTIFRILTTLLLADKGTATVDGLDAVKDFRQVRGCVGYMPGRFSLYQDLTVAENLNFFATLFGTSIEKNYALIADIYEQIKPFSTRRAGKLSGGMKQKLALCCALVHKPRVLFLDEPTTGVDAVSRKEFWDMLKRLKSQGITILVSTPYMDEANLCERIALIQEGRILSIDSPGNIVKAYPDKLYAVKADSIPRLLHDARLFPETLSCYAFGEYLHVSFKPGETATTQAPHRMEQYLGEKGHTNIRLEEIAATIEDSFIQLMGTHSEPSDHDNPSDHNNPSNHDRSIDPANSSNLNNR
ncbi:MAG TPA: ABC transporter ATP-binding protein [Puia sp.]|nr:ABC transporter ATP-binding protein [Puia sp.]